MNWRMMGVAGLTIGLFWSAVRAQGIGGAPTTGPATAPASSDEAKHVTASGLTIIDLKPTSGAGAAATGDTVYVLYTGRLENGTKFDSSADHGNEPIDFKLGEGRVIAGWEEGIAGMKVGDKRQLLIPAKLGYGDHGAGGVIPPNATLIFDVELVGLIKGK